VDGPGLYAQRFSEVERTVKARLWAVFCRDFLQRYVPPGAAVLDLGAGFCEFINHIECGTKYAIDENEGVRACAAAGVQTHVGPAHDLSFLPTASVDVVFTSNLFEHMLNKEGLLTALGEVHRVLRPGGRLLIIQPNIRYAYAQYWDFLDHHLPLSDRSMVEALLLSHFTPREVRPRFLPYSTKSVRLRRPIFMRIYLRCPPLQWLVGRQMFIAADRAELG